MEVSRGGQGVEVSRGGQGVEVCRGGQGVEVCRGGLALCGDFVFMQRAAKIRKWVKANLQLQTQVFHKESLRCTFAEV